MTSLSSHSRRQKEEHGLGIILVGMSALFIVCQSIKMIPGKYRAGRPICPKVLKIMFWEVPPADWLILSYLLPRQALATLMDKHNKILLQIGRPALYLNPYQIQ